MRTGEQGTVEQIRREEELMYQWHKRCCISDSSYFQTQEQYICSTCGRLCESQIGFHSQQQTCEP